MQEIKPAIGWSIMHAECVTVEVQDATAALETIDNDEGVSALVWDRQCGGMRVWGKRLGMNFRLFLEEA